MLPVLSILLPLLLQLTVSTVGSGRSNTLFVSAQQDEEGYYLGKQINAWTFEDPDMKNPGKSETGWLIVCLVFGAGVFFCFLSHTFKTTTTTTITNPNKQTKQSPRCERTDVVDDISRQ